MFAATAFAQNSTDYYSRGKQAKVTKVKVAGVNVFDNMTMENNNGLITFGEVPAVDHNVFAVLTNADGEIIKQRKISQENTTFNTGELEKGIYFVTIMYRNESKKGFILKQE
jgi:hypothetical protein